MTRAGLSGEPLRERRLLSTRINSRIFLTGPEEGTASYNIPGTRTSESPLTHLLTLSPAEPPILSRT